MKVLVIGSGGREHAIAWKISQSPQEPKVYCAPGNAGIAEVAQIVDIKANDIQALLYFALEAKIDLTVVGPEEPLALGIVDLFEANGLAIFGPNQKAAQLEASKVFAKAFFLKHKIPTASCLPTGEDFYFFGDTTQVRDYFFKNNFRYDEMFPVVVKVDGLAAGKGVEVCKNPGELQDFLEVIESGKFGKAADKILLEKCLDGEEVSYILMMDENYNVQPLASSQDHKRALDGDEGLNTGGMGAYSPAPVVTPEVERKIWDRIILPLKEALKKEGIVYKGFLYLGLKIDENGDFYVIDENGDFYVLEINVRLGDPEAQPILLRQQSDLLAHIQAAIKGELDKEEIKYLNEPATCVILASEGYPGSYKKGFPITGIEDAEKYQTKVFHSGTALDKDGHLVTNGGRVLGPTSLGVDFLNSQRNAYASVGRIKCQNLICRSDIGDKAINPELLAQ